MKVQNEHETARTGPDHFSDRLQREIRCRTVQVPKIYLDSKPPPFFGVSKGESR